MQILKVDESEVREVLVIGLAPDIGKNTKINWIIFLHCLSASKLNVIDKKYLDPKKTVSKVCYVFISEYTFVVFFSQVRELLLINNKSFHKIEKTNS